MFEKFGEFGSVEALNDAAKGFLDEGDTEALFALAEENGIDKEDAEDYADGAVEELATPTMAAAGRMMVWEEHLVNKNKDMTQRMAMKVIINMLKTMCVDPELTTAIMQRGKSPDLIYSAMAEEAKKHAAGTGQNRMAVSCGTDQELREIIRTYYLNPRELKKKLAALYVVNGGK